MKASSYFKICIKFGSVYEKKIAAIYLSEIYYDHYKYYRLATDNKMIYLDKDEEEKCKILNELDELKDFTKLKELADKGFVDLQFEVGIKYIENGQITDGECYLELSAQAGYYKAIKLDENTLTKLFEYYINKDIEKATKYLDKLKDL